MTASSILISGLLVCRFVSFPRPSSNLTFVLISFMTSGEEPATSKQLSYLAVLEKQKGVKVLTDHEREHGLTKSAASEKIEALKNQS